MTTKQRKGDTEGIGPDDRNDQAAAGGRPPAFQDQPDPNDPEQASPRDDTAMPQERRAGDL